METFHIILAIKPFKGNFVSNVISELPSGINIGDIRIGTDKIMTQGYRNGNNGSWSKLGMFADEAKYTPTEHEGRFPTNIILEENSDIQKVFPYTKTGDTKAIPYTNTRGKNVYGKQVGIKKEIKGDKGSPSRYFKQVKKG